MKGCTTPYLACVVDVVSALLREVVRLLGLSVLIEDLLGETGGDT